MPKFLDPITWYGGDNAEHTFDVPTTTSPGALVCYGRNLSWATTTTAYGFLCTRYGTTQAPSFTQIYQHAIQISYPFKTLGTGNGLRGAEIHVQIFNLTSSAFSLSTFQTWLENVSASSSHPIPATGTFLYKTTLSGDYNSYGSISSIFWDSSNNCIGIQGTNIIYTIPTTTAPKNNGTFTESIGDLYDTPTFTDTVFDIPYMN